MQEARKIIGLIGFGNMGSAIARGLIPEYKVFVFDKDKEKIEDASGIQVAVSNRYLIKSVDTVILAVKPQVFDQLLKEIADLSTGKLIISIAAGISTAFIEKKLDGARIIRVMPNLPVSIGKGMICLSKGKSANSKDLALTEGLFKKLGETLIISEKMINAATAVSASGPGFFFSLIKDKEKSEIKDYADKVFLPHLEQAAKKAGFNSKEALVLASQTTAGSVALTSATKLSASSLCKKVASPGGTTEAGLKVLKNNIKNLTDAVMAAKQRAKDLSKKE
ncbi:MAG: pyrroline-5-carboxylate reductase [Candidatus Omnitrophica bacterium]|nr:pyrroline-5-carboxylate reductase [Candidatus Omnitrophota bacterium]